MKEFRDAELMEVLKGVSRSFVLTIRALPKGLRRPVGLAYLLARASDTIADTATAPIDARTECLRGFVGMLLGEGSGVVTKLKEIKPENAAEQYLLANLERVTEALEALPAGDREEIVALLRKITRGQHLDLLRFPDATEVRALETADELDEYTYLVAGCVGEFWTRICGAHLPGYTRMGLEELGRLGRGFGQGLQLVNILRDLAEDVGNGRCYLPMSELRQSGVASAEDFRRGDMSRAAPVFEEWRRKALAYHEEGRRYIEAIRPWRIRFACLLPWALGVRTLKLIGERSPLEKRERVKVGRKEVARIMRRAVWGAVSNGVVRKWGEEAG
jgi:farnesyl-diphosphate farnesyltransferase